MRRLRCPYCHDALHDGRSGRVVRCARCGTSLHAGCAREARRCTTLGCAGRPPHHLFTWPDPLWLEALRLAGRATRQLARRASRLVVDPVALRRSDAALDEVVLQVVERLRSLLRTSSAADASSVGGRADADAP